MRLKSAMIYVKDLKRMAEFYTSVLGMKPISETQSNAWVEFDSGLALHVIPDEIAAQIVITSPPEVREETPIKLFFGVTNLEIERQRLEQLGALVIVRPWGGVDVVDPEGNVFQLQRSS